MILVQVKMGGAVYIAKTGQLFPHALDSVTALYLFVKMTLRALATFLSAVTNHTVMILLRFYHN